MNKIFLSFVLFLSFMFFSNGAFANDILPVAPNITNVRTVGLYQVGKDITVYKFPDEESHILYRIRWNDEDDFFPQEIGAKNFFTVYVEKKELALVNVVDIADGWVEIVYNNSTGETGWIREDDPYKFMTWINFYNTYGKKYGLKLLKGAPALCKDMKAAPESLKTISTMNTPQAIHLNIIKGNWALVSVLDMDKTPKTGYVRWRSDDGVRYFFPDIK